MGGRSASTAFVKGTFERRKKRKRGGPGEWGG